MKQKIKLSIAAVVIMFFIVGSVTAQDQTKFAKSDQMMKNMKTSCDSTMMKNHKDMMKDGKMSCDKTMMKDGKMSCDKTMMKDMKMNCDSTMMKNDKAMMEDGKMMCDSSKMMDHKGMMDHGKMMKQNDMKGSHVVRKGVIDVSEIDKNNDGKVYQDVMDWNVISDNPGKCPLCGMKLKEVTVEQAVKNLEKNGFKTK
ncbi:hypothetical protein MNBD_IGNAVI01-1486 [hydrothermal vent metagenome]|uniref:Heavy metal binding domain-containing protein n=1 Tax=hydrothermal vent metagenome TaxID=652676 RepID=A0A3B1BST7_9ZZZZ